MGDILVMLILHALSPMHWATAGAAIALITLALLVVGNRRLGVSTGFEDVCSLALPQIYFTRAGIRRGRIWRLPFVTGLLIGGFVSAVTSGGWALTWDLGLFDRAIGFGPAGKLLWMFGGGTASALQRNWEKPGTAGDVYSSIDGELVPGRLLYDVFGWRSEITAKSVAQASMPSHPIGRTPASPDYSSLPDYLFEKSAETDPIDVVFVDAIPLGATGKMQKNKLRELFKDHRLPGA